MKCYSLAYGTEPFSQCMTKDKASPALAAAGAAVRRRMPVSERVPCRVMAALASLPRRARTALTPQSRPGDDDRALFLRRP